MEPTAQQEQALDALREFLRSDQRCFILKGFAGTGKTFLLGHVARKLTAASYHVEILTPTGRAARVVEEKAQVEARTIHSHIYQLVDIEERDPDTADYCYVFGLKAAADDNTTNIVFVDEASMVSDMDSEGQFLKFGSGRLLTDLFTFFRMQEASQKSRLIFVGDPAQLPPVGSPMSPALSADYLRREHGIEATEFELTEVVRQAESSAILRSATRLRELIAEGREDELEITPVAGEIESVGAARVCKLLVEAHRAGQGHDWFFVTQSNNRALQYNLMIRAALYGGDGHEPVAAGDHLMVVKNDFRTGFSNGDLVTVIGVDGDEKRVRVKVGVELVELQFLDVHLGFRTLQGQLMQTRCKILQNALFSELRGLSPAEQKALYLDFKRRHPELKPNTIEFNNLLEQDPYLNALHVKFGYAATCHKAQGGEWENVVVLFENQRTNAASLRWAYTAITRARSRLYGFNLPSKKPWDGSIEERG